MDLITDLGTAYDRAGNLLADLKGLLNTQIGLSNTARDAIVIEARKVKGAVAGYVKTHEDAINFHNAALEKLKILAEAVDDFINAVEEHFTAHAKSMVDMTGENPAGEKLDLEEHPSTIVEQH